MPGSTHVVRRFEIYRGEAAGLGQLEDVVRDALKEETLAGRQIEARTLELAEAPSRVDVQLVGAPDAAARVVTRVKAAGGEIRRDRADVPLDDRTPGVFPEQQPLLSMPLPSRAEPPKGDVVVAIVDSGLQINHPELAGHIWEDDHGHHGARRIFAAQDHDVSDEDGHGTNLAGTVLSVAGAAPHVKLMTVKFFDAVTRPAAINAARCIDFAADHGANIILLSWDVGAESEELRRAIAGAFDRGALIVFAAGNGGSNNDTLTSVPSLYAAERRDRAITVMAVTRYGEKAWFSNYGDATVDIGAPGVAILSTGQYLSREAASAGGQRRRVHRYNGTSAAAAHVAGAAALIMAHHPNLTAEEVKRSLVPQPKNALSSPDLRRLRCASGEILDVRAALARAAAP